MQQDQADVGGLRGAEQVLEQQAALAPAGRPDVELIAVDAAYNEQGLAAHGIHGGGQAAGVDDVDERASAGWIDARARR